MSTPTSTSIPTSPPPSKQTTTTTNQLPQIVLICLLALLSTFALLYTLDLLSPTPWHNPRHPQPNRVIFPNSTSTSEIPPLVHHLLHKSHPQPPTFIAFYSQTCPHCNKLRRPFLTLSNHFPHARFIAVDLAAPSPVHHRRLAANFGVTHVPTVFFTVVAPTAHTSPHIHKVKYEGAPRMDPLRAFIEQQLEFAQHLRQKTYLSHLLQQKSPSVLQGDKEL